jgi:ATP-dependent DNA helicase 2 subunit 2
MSETHFIIADMVDDKAKMAFSSLIHALFELDSYAVARFVSKDNKHPVLLILAPSIEADFECLLDCELPFAEDIRGYKFPPLDRIITVAGKTIHKHRNLPEPKLQQAMDELVDSMDLSAFGKDDDGKPAEYASIDDTFSPVLHYVNQAIRHHAIHPKDPLPQPYDILTKYMRPPSELLDAAKPSLDAVMHAGNVKRVPAKPKFRGRGGGKREAEKPLSGLDVDELLRPTGGAGGRPGVNISRENAIPEFKQLLQTTEEESDIFEAVTQMQTHVEGYVAGSVGDSGYGRAIEAMRVVREEMLDLEYAGVWNRMLRELKAKLLDGKLGGDRKEFWWKVKVTRLGLITKEQRADSDVSTEEAQAFWSTKAT